MEFSTLSKALNLEGRVVCPCCQDIIGVGSSDMILPGCSAGPGLRWVGSQCNAG